MTTSVKIIFFLIICVCIIVILSFLIDFKFSYIENIENSQKSVELVISRYNEDLAWLNNDPFNRYSVVLYNKGITDDFFIDHSKTRVVKLPNIGRESHTYLFHIVSNYDNLADLTVFFPGSVDSPNKYDRCLLILKTLESHDGSIFPCYMANIYNNQKDFVIDSYELTHESNKQLNNSSEVQPSNIRPFGNWYKHFFKDVQSDCTTFNGIFAVSKENILLNPLSFYEELLHEVDQCEHPEAGHFMERSWAVIFPQMKNTLYL